MRSNCDTGILRTVCRLRLTGVSTASRSLDVAGEIARGIVNLSRGGILLPSVARRFGAEKSSAHLYGCPSQERGAKKVDSTELS
jgi:hypothetical protein